MPDNQQQTPAMAVAPTATLPNLTTALWLVSLTAALSSHSTFKATDLYIHFNLERFDHQTLTPLFIVLLHASLYYLNRGASLIDLTNPRQPHRFFRFLDKWLWVPVRIFSILILDFLKDDAMALTATTYSLFLLCFFQAIAPGFGHKLTPIALVSAGFAACQVSRILEFTPYFLVIYYLEDYFVEANERQVARARVADAGAGKGTSKGHDLAHTRVSDGRAGKGMPIGQDLEAGVSIGDKKQSEN